MLSNHVSSLLAQQNHVVHLRNDMKIASTVINPSRACSNNSLCSDMALIFLQPSQVQTLREATSGSRSFQRVGIKKPLHVFKLRFHINQSVT